MGEVNITYETLFEFLRREKNREELQEVSSSFFSDVHLYLQERKAEEKSLEGKDDLFAVEERKKALIQNENIRKILREFYEKRERKIIALALDCSRMSSRVVDTSKLLQEEKMLYDKLVTLLDEFRKGILINLLENQPSSICVPGEVNNENPQVKDSSLKKIQMSEFVPIFVGGDLKEYGPYEAKDIAELPSDVAEVLIEKGIAEEME